MDSSKLQELGMRVLIATWQDLDFSKSHADPNLYYKVVNNALIILLLYVDDLFLTGAEPLIIQCKRELTSEFNIKDLGLMHYYLGLEV